MSARAADAVAALNPRAEFYDGGWCASWGGQVMVYPQFKSELAALISEADVSAAFGVNPRAFAAA